MERFPESAPADDAARKAIVELAAVAWAAARKPIVPEPGAPADDAARKATCAAAGDARSPIQATARTRTGRVSQSFGFMPLGLSKGNANG